MFFVFFFVENKICDNQIKRTVLFNDLLFYLRFCVDIPRVVWKGLKMGGRSDISQHLYLWHSGFLPYLTLQSYKIMLYVPQSWWESGRLKPPSPNVVMLTLFHANVYLVTRIIYGAPSVISRSRLRSQT